MKKLILARRRFLILVLVLGVVAAVVAGWQYWPHSDDAITTAPHQALYQIRLSKLRQGSQIAGVSGYMSYRIEDACEGWNVAQKFSMQFVYPENPSSWLVSDYNTYESKDGRHFQFSTRRLKNGELTDEVLGKVDRTAPGGGAIEYQKPILARVPLPEDVLFPNQHTLKTLEAARNGQTMIFLPLFDGSDQSIGTDVNNLISPVKKPYRIKVVSIEPVKAPETDEESDHTAVQEELQDSPPPQSMSEDALNNSPLVKDVRAWQIRMAFYPRPDFAKPAGGEEAADEESLTPDYEMTVTLHANGVVSGFTLDYPEFSLDADLISIAEVAENSC